MAQINPEDKVRWDFSIQQSECDLTVIGTVNIVEHWHVYGAKLPEGGFSLPTELNIDKSTNYKLVGDIIEPKPKIVHDDILDEDLYLH